MIDNNFSHSDFNNNSDADTLSSSRWTRVAELSEGDAIAVADLAELGKTSDGEEERSDGSSSDVEESFGSVKFVKIERITILQEKEQVYDIEVEGTHNFVANGIIAHNTVFNGAITQTGNLNITGYASTTAGLFTLGEIRTAGNLTADGNLLVNGNATTTGSQYIGGTASTTELFVQGAGHIGGNLSVDGTLDILGATTLLSNLDLSNNLILNIGHADTDFTSGGGLNLAGNVGIGTTTPDSKLTTIGRIHASSTTEQLRLSYDVSTSKYASFTIDTNGDLNIDLAANNSTTTISDNLSVLGYLNIEGNATTTGSQYIKKDLTVDGQCVTGDTLLPVIKQENFQFPISNFQSISKQIQYTYTRIDEVQSGDYVLSLNEKTGELTPAKIKQLMDMGVKTTFRLTTESGKQIETTGNHPYLTKNGWTKVIYLQEGTEIATSKNLSASVTSIVEDGYNISQNNDTQNNIENNIVSHNSDLFVSAMHSPDKNYQGYNAGRNIEKQKVSNHIDVDFSVFLDIFGLDKNIAKLRNINVIATPPINIPQGISLEALDTNTPITNEPNTIFAPSKRNSRTTFNSLLEDDICSHFSNLET
ncbi:MAG: hypothetical protein L6275_02205, partial [Candidatus Portnoybacteria bacterium]|nr:hypothetical protein [Candidatus Portnoybacteria bacterium]